MDRKHTPKKLGVWVNGILRLQTRDHDAAHEAAHRWADEKNNIWLAPIGSFATT